MPRSQRSNRLPKVRSNDWVELAGACLKVRDTLREHHKILHKQIMEREPNKRKDFWIWVPACDIERMYNDGMAMMQVLRLALKDR